jgi:hypothetical protein
MGKILAPAVLLGVMLGLSGCVQPAACRPVAISQPPVAAPAPAPVHPAPAATAPAEPGYLHASGGAFY